MVGAPALSLELSCRFVTPLLDVADAEGLTDGVGTLIAPWHVTLPELRDESNWVSLRFCEALVEWLATRVGADAIATRVAQAALSPRALGVLYPVFLAFGSPRIGYGALPQLMPRMNKVSAVAVSGVRRGFAEIEYRPADPAHKEESPLVCQLRRAQIAAGPTLWGLPPARVDESRCQAQGAESCRYEVRWVERAPLTGVALGLLSGGAAAFALPHALPVTGVALLAGAALGRIWDMRRHRRELRAFVDEHDRVLKQALDTTERRFEELQRAKAEVDVRVEQRTAELKVATERRVHTEKLAVLGTLAAGLAHEVRNPANAIINGLGPVRRHLSETGIDPDYVAAVQIAIEAGEQISNLVGDLLDVGRTDRGYEPWDPHQGIEAAIRLISARGQQLTFERDFRFRGEIVGRPPALNQIFLNLFDNAVRAAGTGGRIRVTSRPERDGVEITVADSGPGVPPEQAQRIFDPFFTTREVGDGTGLGLHFSRQVAYDHGGSLDIVAAPGWGACFRLWLPNRPVENNAT